MSRLLLVLLGIVFLLSHAAESGEVGVCYGTMGNNLPTLSCGAQLLVDKGVGRVRVYDPDPAEMLTAFANTGIKVAVTLPNELIADAAGDPECAEEWVRDNVEAFYPDTLIESVCVGNEVFKSASELTPQLLPAMENVYRALDSAGLADAVKVTTPVAFDAFKNTFPPSASVFRDDLAESVMCPMLDFLDQTGSYLTVNLFPYIAYIAQPGNISLDYLLFRPNNGVYDPGSKLTYYNLFDAQLDAVYYAMDKLLSSGSRARGNGGRKLLQQGPQGDAKVGETNVAHTGHSGSGPPHKQAADDDGGCAGAACGVTTVENSKAYVGNLINRVVQGEQKTGNRGTPYRPDADIDVYIFALFNENQKEGPEDERNFGLFYPDQTPVYNVDFQGGNVEDTRWCVANPAVGDENLNKALSYACGHGANCNAIQSGGRCFKPDTAVAHASYAFNDYFQRNGRSSVSCDFSGAGYVVYQQPKFGNCELPSTPTDKI
ncbi:glucan endo-1,3-beta-glucosidase GV [Lolium perenne]|uniref:glucan endo-1,3-beta-glucosidase GV n=1 Tax=Lolium perenne TaxID=4522 RepID=UPI0021F5B34D|nr:glucan endo-1,3-beta-glucosidase GII-like [Lolium perenne]